MQVLIERSVAEAAAEAVVEEPASGDSELHDTSSHGSKTVL
jgi:hypothetical protein